GPSARAAWAAEPANTSTASTAGAPEGTDTSTTPVAQPQPPTATEPADGPSAHAARTLMALSSLRRESAFSTRCETVPYTTSPCALVNEYASSENVTPMRSPAKPSPTTPASICGNTASASNARGWSA